MPICKKSLYKAPFFRDFPAHVLIPKSDWFVSIMPGMLIFNHLDLDQSRCIPPLYLRFGPSVKEGVVFQDWNQNKLRFFGCIGGASYCYEIFSALGEMILFIRKAPPDGLLFEMHGMESVLNGRNEWILFVHTPLPFKSVPTRLHLGIHKKQDWTLLRRRNSLPQLLPIWFDAGKNIDFFSVQDTQELQEGAFGYLQRCKRIVAEKNKMDIGAALIDLFVMGFNGGCVPYIFHPHYFAQQTVSNCKIPPLALLGACSVLIKSLFIGQDDFQSLQILPCIPKQLPCGLLSDVIVMVRGVRGTLSITWRKHQVIEMKVLFDASIEVFVQFSPSIRRFRMRQNQQRRGFLFLNGSCLAFDGGVPYVIDRLDSNN